MTGKLRLTVLGNCQAQMLATLFAAGHDDLAIAPTPPVFELTDADRSDIETQLAASDLIFAQRVDKNYHIDWLRIANLREQYGSKLFVWPNIYFDGYFPDVQYLYLNHWGKLQSPLEDYHFGGVIDSHKLGRDVTETVRRMEEHVPEGDTFLASLDRLREREQDVDVAISDFLAGVVGTRRTFYTPNHPYNFALVEMCRRLADAAGMPFDHARADAVSGSLNRIYIPVHRGIRRQHNLPFDRIPIFRGISVIEVGSATVKLGEARSFTWTELVAAYFRVYDRALS